MDILWKALAGGLMTAVIAWAAKRGTVLPGILPLFPSLGLISLWLVGARGDPAGLRQACVAGAKTIPAYLAYLAVAWALAGRVDFRIALLAALGAWLMVALAMFLIPGRA
jgi:membrane protein GlpM